MADAFTPVASGIIPPDPNQGMRSLSAILGIQQQRQALQTGQIEQEGAQARTTQAQQDTSQRQAAASFFKNLDFTDHIGADGTLDLNSVLKDKNLDATGDAKPAIVQALIGMKKSQLDNATTLAGLNQTLVNNFGQTMNSLRENDEVKNDTPNGRAIVSQAIDNFGKQGFDGQRIAAIYGPVVQHAPQGKLSDGLNAIGLQAQHVSEQQQQQNPQAVTNAANQNLNRNVQTGALSAPPGAPPGSPLNPSSPQVAGATTRQTQTGNADIDTSNTVVSAQRDARTNIDLTRRIDQLAEVVKPGAIPSKVSQGLGALGLQDINQARTELQKDLGRLRGGLANRSGSDQRAAAALEGLPTDTSPTQTIHQAMDVNRGMARQDLALGQLREKSAKTTGGNMTGFQGDYAHAVAAASPLMHEYLALSPAEQVGFFQRNFKTKEQAKAFRSQAESVKKLSPDVIGK